MISESLPLKKYWYGSYEGYETRCKLRLQKDLGINKAAAEMVFHLRRQIVELQSHIRQLESELTTQYDSKQLRLAGYRKIYYEAILIELDSQEQ